MCAQVIQSQQASLSWLVSQWVQTQGTLAFKDAVFSQDNVNYNFDVMLLQDSGHTIVLLQPEKDKLSRTFYDFPTLNDALAGALYILLLYFNSDALSSPFTLYMHFEIVEQAIVFKRCYQPFTLSTELHVQELRKFLKTS